MDHLICASLSHTHYWYDVGMLKASYLVVGMYFVHTLCATCDVTRDYEVQDCTYRIARIDSPAVRKAGLSGENEQADAGLDGEMSRETNFSGANGYRDNTFACPVQLTTSRIGNLTRLIHLAICDDHVYLLLSCTYIPTKYTVLELFRGVKLLQYCCTLERTNRGSEVVQGMPLERTTPGEHLPEHLWVYSCLLSLERRSRHYYSLLQQLLFVCTRP